LFSIPETRPESIGLPFALPRIPRFVQEELKFAFTGISQLHVKGCPVAIFRVRDIQIPAAAG